MGYATLLGLPDLTPSAQASMWQWWQGGLDDARDLEGPISEMAEVLQELGEETPEFEELPDSANLERYRSGWERRSRNGENNVWLYRDETCSFLNCGCSCMTCVVIGIAIRAGWSVREASEHL